MKLLVVESPYAGDVERNVEFCENVCRYFAMNGHAPLASHLLYTRFLDDTIPHERVTGIDAGLAWARHATEAAFCLRPGDVMSGGMKYALERHQREGRTYNFYRFTQDGVFLYSECFICASPPNVICADCAASSR